MTRVPIPDRLAELERKVSELTRRFYPTRTRDAHLGNVRETWAARTVEPPEESEDEYPEYEDGTDHLLPFIFIDADVESDLSEVEWTDRSEQPKTHAASRIWLPPGTPIEVAFANGRYRVIWPCPRLLMVRAVACIKPGQGGAIYAQKWDTEEEKWVDDELYGELELCDPDYWVLALKDERFRVTRDCEFEGCFRPATPYLPPRRVKVTGAIPCDASDSVSVLRNESEGCTWTEPDPVCTVTACNLSNRQIGCDADEKATLHWTPGEKAGWLVPGDRARLASAVLASDMCATTATLSSFAAVDVCEWTPRTPVTTAENPAMLYGCAGQVVLLGWDDYACAWIVLQVQPFLIPEEHEFITEIRCGEYCDIEKRVPKGKIAVQWCNHCGEFEWKSTEIAGEYVPVLSEVDCEDSIPGIITRSVCNLCPKDEPPGKIAFTEIHSITNLDLECDEEGEGEGEKCNASILTQKAFVLGCDGESGSIDLGELFKLIRVPTGSPTYEPVLDGEEVIGCKRVQPTLAYCVLGCELGEGPPLEEYLMEIEPLTGGYLSEPSPTGEQTDPPICWTGLTTRMFVAAGCIQGEESLDPSCIETVDCDEEEEAG